MALRLALVLVALVLAAPISAQQAAPGRDTLTIGITQFPSTFHPNIDNMAAKSYVLGFARRPLTAYDPDWALTCLLCERVPSLENGGAARETTPDGKPGIRVTYRLRADARWGDGRPVSSEISRAVAPPRLATTSRMPRVRCTEPPRPPRSSGSAVTWTQSSSEELMATSPALTHSA